MSDHDENVGFGRPPRAHRFKKGASGNPAGRPKGSKDRRGLTRLLATTVDVTVDGRRRRMPVEDALAMSVVQRGLKGDANLAMRVLLAAEASRPAEAATPSPPVAEIDAGYLAIVVDATLLEELLLKLEVLFLDEDGRVKINRWVLYSALQDLPELDADTELLSKLGGFVEGTKLPDQENLAAAVHEVRARPSPQEPEPPRWFPASSEPTSIREALRNGSLAACD